MVLNVNANLGCHSLHTEEFRGVFQYLMASANHLSSDQAMLNSNAEGNKFKMDVEEDLLEMDGDISSVVGSEDGIVVKITLGIANIGDKSKDLLVDGK